MTKKITYDFILLPLPFFLSIFFSFHSQSGRASGEGGWNGLRLHGREGRERRCVVIPLLPRPAPLPPPPLLLYQKGRLHLSYRHVFPCVSSSLAHIASQPPFVILFPRGDPSEMPGALGGWSDLPFVLCFVFSLLLLLLCFVVLVCLSCYRQVRLRSGARYLVSGPLSKSLEISGRK